ncbi:MAG: corrinoid protein [Deltaproteobacteria bacterium]|jgi:methanogenic corrinoid protein MtbC1|nr:corrinoid protein [Deltaproteobacteria bacterium]
MSKLELSGGPVLTESPPGAVPVGVVPAGVVSGGAAVLGARDADASREDLWLSLADAVVNMDEDESARLSRESLRRRYDAYETIDRGLAKGMERAGRLFEEEEYFVPELLLCSDALNAGVEVLKPSLAGAADGEARCRIVIGVISGDTHDIGKNLVKLMLASGSFEIFDLGRDVEPELFVDKALEVGAGIIMVSSLMTTTMEGMREVVRIRDKRGLKDVVRVAVGGGPVSQAFADRIGADAYSPNANHALRLAGRLAKSMPGRPDRSR